MKVLITGANGFIGKRLLDAYIAKGIRATGLVRYNRTYHTKGELIQVDYEDTQSLQRIIRNIAPTWVIHAAGYADPHKSVNHPLACFASTALLTEQVLNAIRDVRPRFCLISSSSVYGVTSNVKIKESCPKSPVTPYGNAKLCAEQSAELYGRLYGIDVLILRVFSVYGPGLRKQVIYDTLYKLSSSSRRGVLRVQGTGLERRDFIYIDDLAEAVVHLTRLNESGIFNVANSAGVRIIDLINQLVRITESEVTIETDVSNGALINWQADIDRLRATGFKARTTLADGLKKTVAWYKRNIDGEVTE